MQGILTVNSSRLTLGVAALLCAALMGIFLLTNAQALRPMPESPQFLAMVGTAGFLLEGLTAYLLIVHFAVFRAPVLGVLGAAYGFGAVMALLHVLSFPGVFTPAGILHAPAQTSVWLWIVWHTGFPLLLIAAMAVQRWWAVAELPERYMVAAVLVACATPIFLGTLAGWMTFRFGGELPPVIVGRDYSRLSLSPAGAAVLTLNTLAVLVLIGVNRLRNVFFVWVTVAAFATLIEVALALAAATRYSLGWYVARSMGLASATVLLAALLWEINHLYPLLRVAYQALYATAVRDEVTGLFNRRYFASQLPARLAGLRSSDLPLGLIMADIDHFKRYNDDYGHQCGDRCLEAVAAVLAAHAKRPGDFAARYGGEELVLVLQGTTAADATAVAERIRHEVEQLRIDPGPPGAPPVGVTLSLGVATVTRGQVMGVEALVGAADAALYRAKQTGRNRVCLAPDPPRTTGTPLARRAGDVAYP